MPVPFSTKPRNWVTLVIIGVTETWLHDEIRDDEICLQVTPYFVETTLPIKKDGGIILYVKPNLLLQRVLLPPTTPLHFM